MYSEIATKIETIVGEIAEIKEVFNYPLGEGENPTRYPALMYFPAPDFDNRMETTNQNLMLINYKIYIIVSGTSLKDIYSSIMPNILDKVREKFDANWNFGVLEGSRMTAILSSGGWEVVKGAVGLEVIADNTLTIKFLTNN